MTTQPEAILEQKLIKQLNGLGFDVALIENEDQLLENLKTQLGKFNNTTFTYKEFNIILNHLSKGNVFQKAKTLRDRFHIKRDDDDSSFYVQFFDSDYYKRNLFQVTNQVKVDGLYKNRYDITILINGLPLVQIELKRRGLELKEAFNQINRYQRHSFWANAGLFQYIQIFVISNGINTKYYANNKKQSFKQTFFWADFNNKNITELTNFTDYFLNPDHLGKMIAHYVVMNETWKILMVLRPYQFYAVEAMIEQVYKKPDQNGYIWHTTGSGKTLTSFKASQIIMDLPEVDKVVFVVDRKDLDYQTIKEFNSFKDGSIDGTDNTKILVDQFSGTYKDKDGEIKNPKLIITTIQKLNNAVSTKRHESAMAPLKDKRVVFIFDECHRSQFGQTHQKITSFFRKSQLFGFTGTPIFAENAQKNEMGKRTTKDLFGEKLHSYVITDAIRDQNVLKFSIEYLGRYKQKGNTFIDIEVEDIDTQEVIESPQRMEKIVDYVLNYHNLKTYNKDFSSIFAVSSIKACYGYYEIFKKKIAERKINLRVASIFTFGANEDDFDADGFLPADNDNSGNEPDKVMFQSPSYTAGKNTVSDDLINKHSREKLDQCINDYNAMYHTSFSTKDSKQFENYYKDISKRLKEREKEDFQDRNRLDILLVVNMFLTGFDAKMINTLYVDKNLKYHGLIQAFSRTNRIINDKKAHGNILCFRNLKKSTDEAIALFSNKDAREEILLPPYDVIVRKFSEAFAELLKLVPTIESVDGLPDEEAQLKFIQLFRELMRIRNILVTFADFSWDDLPMQEQAFEDYKSKYLDLHDMTKSTHEKEKASILNDVDFELELIHRDEINVTYILKLLAKLKEAEAEEAESLKKKIFDALGGDIQLRSKRELIEKFISKHLPVIDSDFIDDEFEKFWQDEKILALNKICEEENLDKQQFKNLIEAYIFSEKEPLRDDIYDCLEERPSLMEARKIGDRILAKMKEYIQVFVQGMVG